MPAALNISGFCVLAESEHGANKLSAHIKSVRSKKAGKSRLCSIMTLSELSRCISTQQTGDWSISITAFPPYQPSESRSSAADWTGRGFISWRETQSVLTFYLSLSPWFVCGFFPPSRLVWHVVGETRLGAEEYEQNWGNKVWKSEKVRKGQHVFAWRINS